MNVLLKRVGAVVGPALIVVAVGVLTSKLLGVLIDALLASARL